MKRRREGSTMVAHDASSDNQQAFGERQIYVPSSILAGNTDLLRSLGHPGKVAVMNGGWK